MPSTTTGRNSVHTWKSLHMAKPTRSSSTTTSVTCSSRNTTTMDTSIRVPHTDGNQCHHQGQVVHGNATSEMLGEFASFETLASKELQASCAGPAARLEAPALGT
eukprot:5646537-Pyramimonas_sp.AAC.1